MNTGNPSPDLATFTEECKICGIQNINMQEHVFSNGHISQVKLLLDCGKLNDSNDAVLQTNAQQHQLQPHQVHNIQPQKLSTPIVSVTSASRSSTQQAVSSTESIGFYNQFLLQNHLFGQISEETISRQHISVSVTNTTEPSGSAENDDNNGQKILHDDLNSGHPLVIAADIGPTRNNLHQNQAQETQILMENNLLLQINADNASTTNSEILQQLYNYSHMSGELIK